MSVATTARRTPLTLRLGAGHAVLALTLLAAALRFATLDHYAVLFALQPG